MIKKIWKELNEKNFSLLEMFVMTFIGSILLSAARMWLW